MPVDLDKIRALLASVAGFTEGPWRMSIENGSGIVAGHRHAVVSADSSALGWPVVLVERRSRPVMLAAPDLHRELTEAVGEIERLRAELEKPVAREWKEHGLTWDRDAGNDLALLVRQNGWRVWALDMSCRTIATGPETGDAGRHAADLALLAAGYRLVGGVHPLPDEVRS